MKRVFCFLLIFILSFSLINFKMAQVTNASSTISASPPRIQTKKDEVIYVDTGGRLCYVRYTSNTNRPSVNDMWRIPAGNSYQDFNVPGEWYLHVYVPSTGEWAYFGPYQRDSQPPSIPIFQGVPEGKWVNKDVTYNIVCLGDKEDHGYDAINKLWTKYASGFLVMQWWDEKANTAWDYPLYQTEYSYTETKEGWHTEWARASDVMGNFSEWSKAEFGIDKHRPTLQGSEKGTPTITNDGQIVITCDNMQDHGLSGNKQITFTVWKDGGSESSGVTKVIPVTTEGATVSQSFSYSELGGGPNDLYHASVTLEDNAGNAGICTIDIKGNDSNVHDPITGDTSSNDPNNPNNPGDEDGEDEDLNIPEGNVGAITFNPNETIWTNKGKKSESEGKFPVKVEYTGDNPFVQQGIAIIEKTNSKGETITKKKKIRLEFPLEGIEVSDAADDFIDGDKGTTYIEQEGYNLKLHGEGVWGYPDYDEPEDCVGVEYDDPPTPVGDSKYYNLDWTKPEIKFNMDGHKIFSEENGASRKQSILGKDDSFYGKLSVSDNLSGVKFIEYKWTYGNKKPTSGYTNIYESSNTNTDRSSEVITKEIEKPVGDNLYLHVRAGDVAGDNGGVGDKNIQYECFGPFEDPIKLTDFQVTDIRDPRWHSVFWNDDSYNNYKDFTYKADKLPIDEDSHPTLENALPKKGYAFYFDITSEYLYREKDRIEIRPTFYYLKDNQRIRADAYYSNNNNPLVQFGTSKDDSRIFLDTDDYGKVLIGNYNNLTLTKGVRIVKGREWIDGWKDEIQYTDGKIQWWYGKYYIPPSTFFVKAGDAPRPENKLTGGDILINFEIIAYKNGVETVSTSQIFNYTKSQWNVEGGPKSSKYSNGDTIIYNAHYSANSDKEIFTIH